MIAIVPLPMPSKPKKGSVPGGDDTLSKFAMSQLNHPALFGGATIDFSGQKTVLNRHKLIWDQVRKTLNS